MSTGGSGPGPGDGSPRVVALVDSDSYVKWGASLLASLPDDGWRRELAVVDVEGAASAAQLRSALTGLPFDAEAVPRRTLSELIAWLAADPPDAVLVSTRGEVADEAIAGIRAALDPAPAIVSGLPGISYPAQSKGIFFRAGADLFVLHSHREVHAYETLSAACGVEQRYGLATLPFLRQAPPTGSDTVEPLTRDRIVFAAQPTIPRSRRGRMRIVRWLARTARLHPELTVVIKVRALAGEAQTHREDTPYARLLPRRRPSNLVVEAGPMSEHLERAVGFCTVSSTATIEAIAQGVPSIVFSDFGVSGPLINLVFEGSGLLGTRRELAALDFKRVREDWLRANYFHPTAENDWATQLSSSVAERRARVSTARSASSASGG